MLKSIIKTNSKQHINSTSNELEVAINSSLIDQEDLLKAYLAKKYHISLIENPWLWVINFEIISEDMSKTSVNITEEKIKSLVELSREVDWSQLTAL